MGNTVGVFELKSCNVFCRSDDSQYVLLVEAINILGVERCVSQVVYFVLDVLNFLSVFAVVSST